MANICRMPQRFSIGTRVQKPDLRPLDEGINLQVDAKYLHLDAFPRASKLSSVSGEVPE
jgi:hypothetical protein